MMLATVITILLLLILSLFLWIGRKKNVDIILKGMMVRRKEDYEGLKHVFFCFVDHFEPFWNGADEDTAIRRVQEWRLRYSNAIRDMKDKGGRSPQHTFFYPAEEYHPECMDLLCELKSMGFGDIEIHLHHDRDTSEGFRRKITEFRDTLFNRHGLLHLEKGSGIVRYGFIHGNWALDDSGVGGRYCGVRDEITILKETGCYADFTYPSAPHPTQPPVVNRIYYAVDDPGKAKSHHKGVDACFGSPPAGDLLLITGPLAINWRKRKRRIFPAIENGDITGINPPTPERVDLWIKLGITVRDWPKWVFVKVHTHGAQEGNAELLLGKRIRSLYEYLHSRYDDGINYMVHYVNAWEMYNCVKALECADEKAIRMIEEFDYSLFL